MSGGGGRGFDFDVAIIGGGPAGTSTALHLVRDRGEGIRASRIVVIDKARFPRDKPCAGAISQLGVDTLTALGIEVRVPFVVMRGVRLLWRGEIGETPCGPRDMGVVVRRTQFDAQLLEDTRASGVEVREGDGLTGIERISGGFRLTTGGGAITARLVAAADGAGSTTRKLLGWKEPERKGHLYVLETDVLPTDDGVQRDLVDFDLSVLDDGLEGYYWDFPTVIDGRRAVSRGIYHANLARADERVDVKGALARSLAKRGVDLRDVKPRPFSTRPYVRGSTITADGLLLVGESAGIDHTTGEGIAQAIVMGGMAARHLARALRTGGRDFDAYARDVRTSTMGRHMIQSAWLARHVYGRFGGPARRLLLDSDYARVAALRWYRGESLSYPVQLRLAAGLTNSRLAG